MEKITDDNVALLRFKIQDMYKFEILISEHSRKISVDMLC